MTNNRFKFRVWDKDENSFSCCIKDELRFGCEEVFTIPLSKKDTYIIQQFTGYQDSEGNDIYEGDILKNMIPTKYSVNLFVVKWGEFESSDDMGFGGVGFILPWFYCNFKPKIIGNVFENSELLK